MISFLLLILAGLVISASLFEHKRLFILLATGVAFAEVFWLTLTLITREFLSTVPSSQIYIVGGILLLAVSLGIAKIHTPKIPWGRKRHDVIGDAIIITCTLVVLLGAWVVVRANGFDDNKWVTHGFYNGDTATLIALTQKSLHTNNLVTVNPFAAQASLEYPTLLHAGLAGLLGNADAGSWLYYLPTFTYATIMFTIPMFFFFLYTVSEKARYMPALLVAALAITVSWDGYVYPQSHFFLTGIFLLLCTLLYSAYQTKGTKKRTLEALSVVTAAMLLLSNAVTGTAAAAILGVYMFLHALPERGKRDTAWYAIAAAAVVAAFISFAPGEPALNAIGFSYTAAPDMLRLTPVLVLLLFGLLVQKNNAFIRLSSVTLLALAFVVFIFSGRDIVVGNASRFFYHAILLGMPLMLEPMQKVLIWIKQNITFAFKDIPAALTNWGIGLVALGVLLLPSLASIASAYDNLLFKDEQVIDTANREALWWIDEHTDANAVVAVSPEPPFAVPMFTGRTIVRSEDFWLSPNDVVLEDLRQTFTGDSAAAEQIFPLADYLLLQKEERLLFEPLPDGYEKVFDNNAVVIYKLR